MNLINLTNPKRNYYPFLLHLPRPIISGGKINRTNRGTRRRDQGTKRWKSACLRAMAVSTFFFFFPLLPSRLAAAHFRSQILATDAFGPLGSCSDVCDEISSTADFDLPSRDRNDLEALDARARQTANIAILHSSVTRKSAWGIRLAYFSLAFWIIFSFINLGSREGNELWINQFQFFIDDISFLEFGSFFFGIDRDFDGGLGKWFVNVFDDEEIYEGKARGDCKEKKRKRLIVWRINTIYNSLFIWDWKEEL